VSLESRVLKADSSLRPEKVLEDTQASHLAPDTCLPITHSSFDLVPSGDDANQNHSGNNQIYPKRNITAHDDQIDVGGNEKKTGKE